MTLRYKMVGDESGHEYAIPVDKSDDWEEWLNSEAAELGDELPDYAIIVGGYFSFTDPRND